MATSPPQATAGDTRTSPADDTPRLVTVACGEGESAALVAHAAGEDEPRYYAAVRSPSGIKRGSPLNRGGTLVRGDRLYSDQEMEEELGWCPRLFETLKAVRDLRGALEAFFADNVGYPPAASMAELSAPSAEPGGPALIPFYLRETRTDAWGSWLSYRATGDEIDSRWPGVRLMLRSGYEVRSAGPDQALDTDDDLVFRNLPASRAKGE